MNAFCVPVHVYHDKHSYENGDRKNYNQALGECSLITTEWTAINKSQQRDNHSETNLTDCLSQLARGYSLLKGFLLLREMSANESKATGLKELWGSFDREFNPALRRMSEEEKHQIRKFDYQGNKFLYQRIGAREETISSDESSMRLTPHMPLGPVSPNDFNVIRRSIKDIPPRSTPKLSFSNEKVSPINNTSEEHSNFLEALAAGSRSNSLSHSESRGSLDPVRFTFGSE
ncbi:hypothetical protein XU18_0295 [Perkinsela sp. CCAP 1560/4]|nr:hypothetical protein XU18_0295 [Perkinsela sp. CCAP 1560/4]|eukprot:KNH09610.1 hypothetical protein XU18_0295 [Perkinsela sp. CCAP 1560/4]